MLKQLGAAAALLLAIQSGAIAQTMRFTTNVGSFDMVLNPNNDPDLQPLVDNIVAYIGLGRYSHTAVTRAVDGGPGTADDFVLQMGGFMGFPPTPENYLGLVRPVEALSPVVVDGPDAGNSPDFDAISNTRGTVSLALRSGDPNSGTSSFFINLKDNSLGGEESLDAQGFVPFARVNDMTTIDRIMRLTNEDLTGAGDMSAFDDVPLTEKGRLVILQTVRVLEAAPEFSFVGPISAALNRQAQSQPPVSSGALAAAAEANLSLEAPAGLPNLPSPFSAVPEPASAIQAAVAAMLMLASRRRV